VVILTKMNSDNSSAICFQTFTGNKYYTQCKMVLVDTVSKCEGS